MSGRLTLNDDGFRAGFAEASLRIFASSPLVGSGPGTWQVLRAANTPATDVWLPDGDSRVIVALSRKVADAYAFTVQPGMCSLPDTSGNTLSPDGTLEYAASGKSYATVQPGCAFNPRTGLAQPFVNLFDNGAYLLNVAVNSVALTQLNGTTRKSAPVFLGGGLNVISAADGYVSTDYYVRDGGSGSCALP